MSALKSIYRPDELSALLKLKLGSRLSQKEQNNDKEYNEDIAYCFDTLDKVSRSFAAVIHQLPQELATNICLFYLILRALDSIEDDMSFDKKQKVALLRTFHEKNYEEGWTITDVGDKEEYRELLKNYDKVIRAFKSIDSQYQQIITEICQKMGAGMADFVDAEIVSVADYNLYCHYVAGLVGVGLSKIFAVSDLEDQDLQFEEELSNDMGLFLQKTNIVRDYKEDLNESRTFWPKEIWSQYGTALHYFASNPKRKDSINCLNHMVNDALAHVIECLEYLKKLKNERVFKFCAIPQVMAIATLREVYNNPKVFLKNVKIRKGFAAKLIVKTNTIQDVIRIFKDVAQSIERSIPDDHTISKETLRLIEQIKVYCETESINLKKVS